MIMRILSIASFQGSAHRSSRPCGRLLIAWKLLLLGIIFVLARPEAASAQEAGSDRVPFKQSISPLPPDAEATSRAVSKEHLGDMMEFEIPMRMRDLAGLEARVGGGEIIPRDELERDYLPLEKDYAAVVKWLKRRGFSITQTAPSRLSVFARGSVERIQRELQVEVVSVTVEGADYHAARTSPSLPAEIAGAVLGVNGLQPYLKLHKHSIIRKQSGLSQNDLSGAISYSPPFLIGAITGAYNGNNLGVTGSGQKIAILIDTVPNNSDLTAFWSANGIAQTLSNIEEVNVNNVTLPSPSGEETLDVEWSSGIAPGVKVRVYAAGSLSFTNLDAALLRIISDLPSQPMLHQMSISLGLGETYMASSQMQTDSQYFATIASSGVSIFVSSGDAGSNPDSTGHNSSSSPGPLQVEYYASDPSVTGVGGTSLYMNSTSGQVTSEVAWPDSGGGASQVFARPSWQTGTGVPAGSFRMVPDVSAASDPNTGAYLYLNGGVEQIGGTSWASPTWAGFCALINQARANVSLGPMGLLGPKLYPLLGSADFRDITSGNNGQYSAGVGYDAVTGIGTPNVANLLAALTIPSQSLTVTLPATATEGDGLLSGTLTTNLAPSSNISVYLISSNSNKVLVASPITLGAGQTAVTFPFTIVDNSLLDGTQIVTITPAASGYTIYSGTIAVADNETATLGVTLPASATKDSGLVTGTLSCSAPPDVAVSVSLISSDTTTLQVPQAVTLPAGQTQAMIPVTVVDNGTFAGPRSAMITAHVQNWTDGSGTMSVLDNYNLMLAIPAAAHENDAPATGTVSIDGIFQSDVVVSLNSDNTNKALVPASVTIPQGQTSGTFAITFVNDNQTDGTQPADITATATSFNAATATINVLDANIHHFTFGSISSPQIPNVPFAVSLAASDINGVTITNYTGSATLSASGSSGVIPLNPVSASGFVNGVWTGNVTVGATDPAVILTATDSAGHSGVSNSFAAAPGSLTHFGWSAISSPQGAGVPFPVIISALDAGNNVAPTFTGTASLRIAGTSATMLNGAAANGSANYGTFTIGYSFTPSTALTVTGVRSYSGTKVSVWTSAGQLLVAVPVSGPGGLWTDTALSTPLQLAAGTTYVIGEYTAGATYYWDSALIPPFSFAQGTITASRYASSDAFPSTVETGGPIYPVDLKYTYGGAAGSASVSPSATGTFSAGTWAGNISVQPPASSLSIVADDGIGQSGTSGTFNCTSTAWLSVSPNSTFATTGVYGGPFSPSSQTYTLSNVGSGALGWTAAITSNWLTLSSSSGTLASGATATLTATVNSNAYTLASGTFTDAISFANITTGGGNTSVPVMLTSTAAGILSVTPSAAFLSSGTRGGPFAPISQIYNVSNTGNGAMNWGISGAPAWLTLSSTSGNVAASGSTAVTVTINSAANALASGTSVATLSFSNLSTGNGSTTRAVDLTVLPYGVLSVSGSAGLMATGTKGGPFSPGSQSYVLSNTGDGSLTWNAMNSTGWLSLSPTGGTLAAGGTAGLTVSINSAANVLGSGTFSDTVQINNASDGMGSTTRPVTLTAFGIGVLSVSPQVALSGTGNPGGPFAPTSQSYTLTNTGDATLSWTASYSSSWLSLSGSAGSLAPGSFATVTLTINANANSLSSGFYSDGLLLTNLSSGQGNAQEPVTLQVNALAPLLQALPTYTGGLSETVTWSPVAGASLYEAQCSTDPSFGTFVSSGWITGTSFTFTGLSDGVQYYYRVHTQQNLTGP